MVHDRLRAIPTPLTAHLKVENANKHHVKDSPPTAWPTLYPRRSTNSLDSQHGAKRLDQAKLTFTSFETSGDVQDLRFDLETHPLETYPSRKIGTTFNASKLNRLSSPYTIFLQGSFSDYRNAPS